MANTISDLRNYIFVEIFPDLEKRIIFERNYLLFYWNCNMIYFTIKIQFYVRKLGSELSSHTALQEQVQKVAFSLFDNFKIRTN